MIRRFINRNLLDQWDWGTAIADLYSAIDRFLVRPKWLRSLLHGTWLGHPLHPLLTDVPIGALTVALILDLLGISDGANWATLIGFAGLLLAAAAGFVDLDETAGKARQYGGVHASLMLIAIAFYLFSLAVRYGYTPGTPYHATVTAAIGYAFIGVQSAGKRRAAPHARPVGLTGKVWRFVELIDLVGAALAAFL